MAYTLNGISLGNVEEKDQEVTSDLDTQSFPMSGSKDTEALDYSGVIRIIKLSGTVVAATTSALFTNFIAPIDLLQNGNQSTVVYHSQLLNDANVATFYPDGNIDVKVRRFRWSFKKADVGVACSYDLELVESV